MAIMLDADVIIRREKGEFEFSAWLGAQAEEPIEIAAISVAELWHGVERAVGGRRIKRQRHIQTDAAAPNHLSDVPEPFLRNSFNYKSLCIFFAFACSH
jgi:predicted nucleic acid-binding protein